MANLNVRRFTHPETLRKIERGALLTWLAPAAGYLGQRGVVLPENTPPRPSPQSGEGVGGSQGTAGPTGNGEIDYDKLAGVFMQPDEAMPAELVESLYVIHEMADERGMDAILQARDDGVLALEGSGDQDDPADVAVRAWLENRAVVEALHNQHQLTRSRSFEYLIAEEDPLPAFTPPSAEQVRALESRLNAWYVRKKRGGGCRVLVFPKGDECWFLVRHGLPCKREGALNDGQPTSVFYRPQKHDVVVYDAVAGELRVNCCGRRELEEFRQAFGVHLFGDDEFFPGTSKFTLAPLVMDGRACLVCADVEGVESVMLREVEVRYGGKPGHQIIHKSEDIFRLEEEALFQWPDVERIARAVFEVKFLGSKTLRRVTIKPSNKAMYGRDEDAVLVEQWLKARGFLLALTPDEDGGALVAVS